MLFIRYLLMKVASFYIKIWYLLTNKKLILGFGSRILLKSKFEGYNKIERFATFGGELGYGSYIGTNSIVIGSVGRYTSIGNEVRVVTGTHPVKKFVSTHPSFYSLKKQAGFTYVTEQKFIENPKLENEEYSVVIENDVYIGQGVTLVGPIRIGNGAVIAANSIVVSNVEPYTIVAGSPARVIRNRFSEEQIEFLQRIKWWDNDISWMKKNVDLFEDVQRLYDNYN